MEPDIDFIESLTDVAMSAIMDSPLGSDMLFLEADETSALRNRLHAYMQRYVEEHQSKRTVLSRVDFKVSPLSDHYVAVTDTKLYSVEPGSLSTAEGRLVGTRKTARIICSDKPVSCKTIEEVEAGNAGNISIDSLCI